MLKQAGTKKINFAGGEPFIYPKYLGELIKQCKENIKIEKISVITNGSLVKKDFFEKFGKYIDVFGVSCDSFKKETNIKIGRGKDGENVQKLFEIRKLCKEYGIKLIGNYQFDSQPGYRSAGHNSALVTDDGKYFLIYHQRFLAAEMGEGYEVRVHQQFLNEDNWLVTAVYEYKNEAIRKYAQDEILGTYEFINHGNVVQDGSMLTTGKITLAKGGDVYGDATGTWTISDGDDYTYVTLTLSNVDYKGVFYIQTDDNGYKKMTFSAIGSNNLAIWGSSKFIIN